MKCFDASSILEKVVNPSTGVPGVVAMATNRHENVYAGAVGVRSLKDAAVPMSTDSVFAIFSCTKAITATAALQLIEEGRMDLDAPAQRYAPDIGKLKVIEGFDASGGPILRAPKSEITVRMLLLHTAGFGYDHSNEAYCRLAETGRQPRVVSSSKASLMIPLLFDPGSNWEYGISIDWLGQVIEAISGKRLGEVFQERIFKPLGMHTTAFTLSETMRAHLAGMHTKTAEGMLEPMDFELPVDPEVHMGGHGLYGTVGDYMRFIRMWLNDGMGEYGRVLKPETVALAVQNHLGSRTITTPKVTIPALSNGVEFFPGLPKSWSFSFMVNNEIAPTGRPAGALGWAGLANLFYWIDRKNGIGGFWATQIFPFGDAASFTGFMDFETECYRAVEKGYFKP